ncbi:Uncharacterised protein [Mycobacteroides abscessus subsp. abscessus]|nr:Uncharacterised protein [Mycobacteroides abscessus subsp. abscessus]
MTGVKPALEDSATIVSFSWRCSPLRKLMVSWVLISPTRHPLASGGRIGR